jgi:cyclohexyl-isocyanide hydratase
MNRRQFHKMLGVSMAASIFSERLSALAESEPQSKDPQHATAGDQTTHGSVSTGPPQQIAMLIYPEFTAQDLIGPHTFLASLTNVQVHLVWKDKNPVALDRGGASLNPTTTFAECPRDLDVLFAPGGLRGTVAAMRDPEVLGFLADRGKRARYITSVCTGSILLGCAGLLQGYRATSHWATRDILPLVGATPVAQRVVEDRNRITGAGVTSGIDFGLLLAARMRDERFAKMLQLRNEYDPQPPYHAGSPEAAGTEITDQVRSMLAPGLEQMRAATREATKGFKN